MITLDLADLVVIASRTLRLDTGEVLDLLDTAAAERALALVRPGSGPGDPAGLAAALLHALVQERPLRRGNQQVALAAMLQFLGLNGWELDPDPPGQVAAVVAELAAGTIDVRNVADWLAPRLRPSDRAGTLVKEALVRRGSALLLAERIKRATMRTQPEGMFHRFTDRARRVVHLSQEEARLLRHDQVGCEHLLLGLLYEGEGVGATALESLGISLQDLRGQVREIAGRGQAAPAGHIPFTPGAKEALELALRQALALGHSYIGTEHLLLALSQESEGIAAQVLAAAGADHARLRDRVLGVLTGGGGLADPQTQMVRVTVPADLVEVAEQLMEVQRDKEAAFNAGDLEAAASLRDREQRLRAEKLRLEQRLTACVDVRDVAAENHRLHSENDRLRGLLREHGIEPDSGSARTA